MAYDFKAAAKLLTDDERDEALENYLENNGGNDAESGIARQILGGDELLSEKQQYIYDNNLAPCLAAECRMGFCTTVIPSNREFCFSCEIKFAVPGQY